MPQLDPSSFAMQLFWLAITFVVLYVLMAKVALPRVGAAIDARAAKIDGDLGAATAARDQANALAAAHELRLAQARDEARTVLRDSFREMQAEMAKRETEISAQIGAEAKAADLRIAEAKHKALGELRSVALEAVAAATQKLIGEGVAEADVAKAVDQAIGGRQ
jgi:F-type H+-transporting ATPase subunit b